MSNSNISGKKEEDKRNDNNDLPDSRKDELKMQQEEVTLNLPDVTDIPGQEHIIPPRLNEFADVTITSDSDEGTAVFGKEEEEENNFDENSSVQ